MDIVAQHQDKALELKYALWGSFTLFCKTFFPLITGRDFKLSSPVSRESHFTTIAKELTLVARMQSPSLLINVPPGSGKSTMLAMWVAWTMSQHPDSQYLYISYGHELAAKHTEFIRRIIQCPYYQALFAITIRHDMKAKDHFVNNFGGSIKAFGSSGPITGQDGGLPNCDRFTGAIIMDDMHKPDEAHSDTIRHGVIKNYQETIVQRPRAPNVPMIFIGQRLHEDDLPAFFLSGKDERTWRSVVLQAIDSAGNALYPEVNPLSQLLEKKDKNPYVFSSQYQQEPIPAGGALFKEKDFVILDEEPNILCTFITADTAETSKTYNDATVFSFWGLYKLSVNGQEIEHYGLHWLDCWEMRVEPKELEYNFKSFYAECMLHSVKPLISAIEKKSTGVTLCSVLQSMRGLEIREVKRTSASGSKANRYIDMQAIIAAKLISFTSGAKHIKMCVDHMVKITANDSHRHDDICDTVYDAIKMALIDKTLFFVDDKRHEAARNASKLNAAAFNQRQAAIKAARGY
ncbi:MAG: terminase large subunit [Caudoviricetes sp.]|nr:MAG: terminase large subunit [Caudoviricetes sp.]